MNGRNDENLKELFEKFLNSEQAERAADDIQKAEQILSDNPAPLPDDILLADIKTEIAGALVRSKINVFRRRVYRTAAVAAAVIILAVISVKVFEKGGDEPQRVITASMIPAAIWESGDFTEDDAEIAMLAAEIEQIESEMLALRLGEDGGNGDIAVTELEMELIETNSDFWKG